MTSECSAADLQTQIPIQAIVIIWFRLERQQQHSNETHCISDAVFQTKVIMSLGEREKKNAACVGNEHWGAWLNKSSIGSG